MKLKSLELWDFKGISHFKMEPDGENVHIYADNKKGKTCVADSLPWLFYDLDSQGKTFNPKPLDLTGEAAHGIESIVEAAFTFNNGADNLILKKSLCENWTKKHGTGKKVFEGHTTQYYVDDMEVSVRKKDYDGRLNQIANSTILKLLSSTKFFAEGVQKTKRKDDPNRWDWEKRRELLFDLSDDMPTDEDIVLSNPMLSRMAEILDGKSAEKRKAIIKERQKGLNKLINEIPISIKERKRDMPDVSGIILPAIEKELSELSKALTQKNEEAARIESGGEIAEKIKKQRGIESRLLEIENSINKARNKAESEQRKKALEAETAQRKKVAGLEADKEGAQSSRDRALKEIKLREGTNKEAEQEIIKLRVDWNKANDAVFNELDTVCPTCGQDYPEEKADEIRGKFHVEKAKTLDRINQAGRAVGAAIVERKDLNETDQADISLYEEKIEELIKQISKAKAQTESNKETEKKKPFKNKEQEVLELDLTEIKLSVEGLRADSDEAKEIVESEIAALTGRQEGINLNKQTLENYEKDQARIKELGAQQKVCAKEFEELEKQTFILNEFTKTKAAMVEEKISGKFAITEFKLFNLQVNGEVDDCCRVKHQGICWDAGLNNSSQTYVGVDCINTLSEHYGLALPIMVDNAESILHAIPSKSQIIKLVASETVQCAECDWTGLHSETDKELDDGNIVTGGMCPKCGEAIKKYKGLVVRHDL